MIKLNKCPLADLLELVIDHRGKTPKKLRGSWSESGIPVLSANHVKNGSLVDLDAVRYIDEQLFDKWMPQKLDAGDIILTSEGPLGQACYLGEYATYCLGQRLFGLRANPQKIDARYLYYFLISEHGQRELHARATGTTVQGIRQSELLKISVIYPDISVQKAISHILGSIDDKIDLNKVMNQILESLVRVLFRRWFIDYNFPAEDGRPYHSSGGRMVSTHGREIPEGWTFENIGSIAENRREGVKPKDEDPETPYIGLEHMPRRSISLDSWGRAGDVVSGKLAFHQNDILFGKLRPYFHKVGIAPLEGVCSTDILVVTPKEEYWFGLLSCHLASTEFVKYADRNSTGTRMPRTNWMDASKYEVALPDRKTAERFNDLVQPIMSQIHQNIFENKSLFSMRLILLPRLLRGTVTVREPSRILQEIIQ